MSTAPRDPVRDLIDTAARGGFLLGQRTPRWEARLRWLAVGFLLGVLATFLWAGAAAAQGIPPAAQAYRGELVRQATAVWGLDAPLSLLAAQLHQESGWRPEATSRVGAGGLAQFMPSTARDVGERYGVRPVNVFDPRWALRAQSVYLRELFRAIGTVQNVTEQFAFALAAYNGGLGHVRTRQSMSEHPSRCLGATCEIRPPRVSEANQRENAHYPRRIILELMPRYHAAGWGGPALHERYGVRP